MQLLYEMDGMHFVDHFHPGAKPTDHLRRLELDLGELKSHFCCQCWRRGAQQQALSSGDRQATDASAAQLAHKARFRTCFQDVMARPVPGKAISIRWDFTCINVLKLTGARVRVMAWHFHLEKHYDVADYFSLPAEQWKAKWWAMMMEECRK
jgi:hypothetical protein